MVQGSRSTLVNGTYKVLFRLKARNRVSIRQQQAGAVYLSRICKVPGSGLAGLV